MKNPFAKKTKNIENDESRIFVEGFKHLQEHLENAGKQARKIKQTLKNSEDVNNPQKIKQAAKELFDGDDSLLNGVYGAVYLLTYLSGYFDHQDNVVKKLKQALKAYEWAKTDGLYDSLR